MALFTELREREKTGNPLRIGLVGAGKFGSMYLAQAVRTPGIHIVGVVDLSVDNARQSFKRIDWPSEQYEAASLDIALKHGSTCLSEDFHALVKHQVSTSL